MKKSDRLFEEEPTRGDYLLAALISMVILVIQGYFQTRFYLRIANGTVSDDFVVTISLGIAIACAFLIFTGLSVLPGILREKFLIWQWAKMGQEIAEILHYQREEDKAAEAIRALKDSGKIAEFKLPRKSS